ncbi:MAG TPA: gliding-motility protein MglA, partial [bacterium]|nr:gliding-motility protein MglA [bacterium]
VYYGSGLSGKTTNIEYIYSKIDPLNRGKLFSIKTDTERTLFFDFLPVRIGTIKGMKLKVHVYSVAGQVFYDSSRRLILKGCDGIVFVVDSQKERMDANIESFDNLKTNLLMNSVILEKIPIVIQYNKTDLPNSMSIDEMSRIFNPDGKYEEFVACALHGDKVFDTFKTIVRAVVDNIDI